MSAHARLAPSAAHRWIRCPGSVAAEEAAGEQESSVHARLGTAAHGLASHCLDVRSRDAFEFLGGTFDGGAAEDKVDPHKADEEMCGAVQTYLDAVWGCYDRLEGAEMTVEERVRVPGGMGDDIWGTLDCSVSQPFGPLHVFDYKHGAGVVVEVRGNEQLLLYALGKLHEEGLGEHEEVSMHIVQPRARHEDGGHRTWTVSEDEVVQWWDEEAFPAAELAAHAGAARYAGDHCRFCDAAATCPELRDEVQRVAGADFAEESQAPKMAFLGKEQLDKDAERLAESMRAVPMLDAFVKAVSNEALFRLKEGREVPGFKLVRKKSNRAWLDAGEALTALRKMRGVKKADLMTEPALKSPAQVEKVKAVGKAPVTELCYRPPGGLTVAEDSDPRDAADPAESATEAAAADFGTGAL